MRHYRLTCQMRTESAELPHTPEYLASVANDLVKSFTSSHVTEERAGGIRLAFKDVLLVRCALNCGADRGNPRVFSMSVHCATGTLVAQCRSQGTGQALCTVLQRCSTRPHGTDSHDWQLCRCRGHRHDHGPHRGLSCRSYAAAQLGHLDIPVSQRPPMRALYSCEEPPPSSCGVDTLTRAI